MSAAILPIGVDRADSTALSIVPTDAERKAQWLEDRRTMITGTDAAKILGLSRFGGPLDVYLDKTGQLAAKETTMAMESGLRMERAILAWYADVVGVPIVFADPYTIVRSRVYPLIGATLDARRTDDGRPVDAKNVRYKSADWGDPFTDQIPVYYATQGLFQMHVVASDYFDLAALFSGQDLTPYCMARDLELEERVLGRCHEWWETHIVRDVPPPIDGSEAAGEWLKKAFSQRSDAAIMAAPEINVVAGELHELKESIALLEADEALRANRIRAFIGDAKTVIGTGWRANWTQAKDSVSTDWEAVAREVYMILAARTSEREALDAIAAAHAVVKPGSRRFTFTWNPKK